MNHYYFCLRWTEYIIILFVKDQAHHFARGNRIRSPNILSKQKKTDGFDV